MRLTPTWPTDGRRTPLCPARLTFDSANEPEADVDEDDRYDDYTVQDIDEAWELLGGDLDDEESGDAYWRLREIAMPDNEGGVRLDIPDDPFDGWSICRG